MFITRNPPFNDAKFITTVWKTLSGVAFYLRSVLLLGMVVGCVFEERSDWI
jgi:hypothetical protein